MSGDHSDAAIARRVRRMETLLEEKGVLSGARLDEIIDASLSGASPANGARVVARAWTDPG
ncbi:nitrile hydratase subunit alpha, partial [Streptomyces anandii]